MEMCYDGTLVMPSSYAVMDEEEMCYVEGGMSGKTQTGEERFCVASYIAAAAGFLGKLTFRSFKALAATACAGVLSFFNCIGSASLIVATTYEGVLASIAAGFAARGKNYRYTCYGFGSITLYTLVRG